MKKLLDRIGGALEKGVGGLENVGSGIGSILAQMGGAYAPGDLDLNDRQKRGLLSANISDRIYGPGANATPQAPQFLNNIRGERSISSMRDAINAIPGMSVEDKNILNSLPPGQQMEFMQNLMESRFAPNSSDLPSSVREYQFYQGLGGTPTGEADQASFMALKRANPFLDVGGTLVQTDPIDGNNILAEIPRTLRPGELPANITAAEEAKILGQTGSTPLTDAQKGVDTAFASIYAEYELGGGRQIAERNYNQMQDAMNDIQGTLSPEEQGQIMGFDPEQFPERVLSNEENYSGPILGQVPQAIRVVTNSESVDMADRIAGVIQQGLRDTLGAQFAENEGALMVRRAYDETQDEATNLRRLMPLFTLFRNGIDERNRQADYYKQKGSISGFEPGRASLNDPDAYLASLYATIPERNEVEEITSFSAIPGLDPAIVIKLEADEELTDQEFQSLTGQQLTQVQDLMERNE